MNKNEVITLSSDEETDTTVLTEEDLSTTVPIKPGCVNSPNILKAYTEKLSKNTINKSGGVIIRNNKDEVKSEVDENQSDKTSKHSPEVVDLVDFLDKLDEDLSSESDQNNRKLEIIGLDRASKNKDSPVFDKTDADKNKSNSSSSNQTDINHEKSTGDFSTANPQNSSSETAGVKSGKFEDTKNEEFNQNLKIFTEFVEYCGSLEKIPNDRVRLTKKLMKRYGEADCRYIKSQEFRYLIQKCRDKVNKKNLYLIAKEITEELSFRKKIIIDGDKSNPAKEKNQREVQENSEEIDERSLKLSKKRVRFINKIIKKLDKLGSKIRELEKQEVDLSDEEDSTYVMLQRYRERYCQIYKRLCAYTSEIPDPNNRKICFSESKYPAINKCIEQWLNKTKRFPDFSDIMKLLESQSSLLGLPSNRESIRVIAVEIFQKVGAMLQRRRIYDLWDIFCGFLDDGEDPAQNNPDLDQILKKNFETRLKKEQEIFQHYAELQEKEKLEPEEVGDEEANHSPLESGNEDDKEIEDIENCLNKKLDDAIKSAEEDGNILENKDSDRNNSENEPESTSSVQENPAKSKETKNNYRNCKSLKWRVENSGKIKSDTSNSEDSSTGKENEKVKSENDSITKDNSESNEMKNEKTKEIENDDSDLELITVEDSKVENKEKEIKVESSTPSKRVSSTDTESSTPKKKKPTDDMEKKADQINVFDIDDENENALEITNEVFGVHCCQVFADNVFQDLNEKKKDWSKRKVFRDLTNVNRLMELHGKKKKMSELFSPSFFHRSFYEFEKSSWKRRFKVSFRLVGSKNQKCALSQEEKSTKTVNSYSGGDSDEKDIHSNSEGGGDDEGDNYFRSHGSGREEDNNEDKNKKNGGTNDEINDSQHEEDDEEEEENENEKLDILVNTEPLKQFLSIQKTEEPLDSDEGNKSPSENCSDDSKKEPMQLSIIEPETLHIESAKTATADDEKSNEVQESLEEKTEVMCNESREEDISDVMDKDENSKDMNEDKSEEIVTIEDITEETTIDETKANVDETNNKKNNYENIAHEQQDIERETELERESISLTTEELKNYVENLRYKAAQERKNKNIERVELARVSPEKIEVQPAIWRSFPFETPPKKPCRRSTPSTSDEERVKRFLLHSPSSISITPPKKLSFSKPPSQAALQALATLRNLKDISATIVRGKPKTRDHGNAIEGSAKRRFSQNSNPAKRRRTDLPVISSVQSMASTPTIVTVRGNAPGFEEPVPGNGEPECDSSSIRISSVWGSLPGTFVPVPKVESMNPGCSSEQGKANETDRKKNSKKTVEYVVLE